MVGFPIKYSQFFKTKPPKDPTDLVKDIPKDELIATISAVNTRLKPIYESNFDDSESTQIECLRAVFLDLENPIHNGISTPYIEYFLEHQRDGIMFTRVGCLYAYQLILQADGFTTITPSPYTKEQRENIFKLLLIANEKSLIFDKEFKQDDVDTLKEDFFDYFMFKQLPLNQYYFSFNPMNKFYCGWRLFDALSNDPKYSVHLHQYLKDTFGIDDVVEFFRFIMGQYFQSNDDNLKLSYLKVGNEHEDAIRILKKLSERIEFELPDENNPLIMDFLTLKKSPVYWDGREDGDFHTFIIMDGMLFVEKIYSLFINDFWFDYLKPHKIVNRKAWGDFIGSQFFEPLIHESISRIYAENLKICYLESSQLMISIPPLGQIEYCDFYIRNKKEVILIEAKSQYIPTVNGFKSVNTIADFKALDMEKFYKGYGLEQLVKKTIALFKDAKTSIPDKQLKGKYKVRIYPTLILNDSIMSLGFSSLAFRKRFERMLKSEGIQIETEQHRIMPLSIINIMELMDMEEFLINCRQTFDNLLRIQFHSVDIKNAKNTFDVATPFSFVINNWIPYRYRISKRIRKFDWLGFNRT